MEPFVPMERRALTNAFEARESGTPESATSPTTGSTVALQSPGARIGLAAVTGAGAKALALGAQLMSVGVAVRALGADGFALFIVITSLVSWVSLAGIGVAPGLTLSFARATAGGDRSEGARQFVVALLLMLTVAFALVILASLLSIGGFVDFMIAGWLGSASDDGGAALLVMTLLIAAQLVVVVPESAQLGLQSQHVTNLWAAAGSVGAIVAMVAAGSTITSVTAFVMISQAPQVVARCINGVAFVLRHRMLVHPDELRFRHYAGRLVRSGIGFAGLSVASFISLQAGLLIVATSTDAASVALAGVIVRAYMLEVSGLSLITTPTWPVIASAAARGERQWIIKAYRWLAGVTLAYCGLVAVAILVALEPLIEIWTGLRLADDPVLRVLFAAFVLVNGWAHANAMSLVGLGSLRFTAIVLIAESVCVLALLAILVPIGGVTAFVGALAAGAVLVSGWILPLRVSRHLRQVTVR